MELIGTRGGPGRGAWSFTEALFLGQAPDGGLFVPASIPPLPEDRRAALAHLTFPERALVMARHFLAGEVADDVLRAAVHDALDFPVPLREIEPGVHLLELFHGPTHAFKDVGARFMARMMSALRPDASPGGPPVPARSPGAGMSTAPDASTLAGASTAPEAGTPPLTILAATSGDTGGAVARAFHGVRGVRVVVLFPLGRVSPRQEAQFTTLGGNVAALAVRGAFDDCQRLVREAFADRDLATRLALTSANSINIGRLLPQTFYHVHAWMELARSAPDADVVVSVPSGNFGNLTAGLMARAALRMSRARFVAATNDNAVVPEYLAGRGFHPRPSVATVSSAMDVGDPSNFRRIRHLFGGDSRVGGESRAGEEGRASGESRADTTDRPARVPRQLRAILTGSVWSDEQTRACIRGLWEERGIVIDPHTAVGLLGLRRELERRPGAQGIVLATAHPAKFAETVEPLIGRTLPLPPGIASVMGLPRRSTVIAPELDALRAALADAPVADPHGSPRPQCSSASTNATAT